VLERIPSRAKLACPSLRTIGFLRVRPINNCDNNIMGIRNQVLLRLGYETMRRRSELCAFKFEDIDRAPNGNPIIRLNFSKTD
jgi:integrase